MKSEILRSAISLAEKLGHIFVATADSGGTPHVAAAGKLAYDSKDHVSVAAWFCPGTLANLKNNKQISLVVWDAPWISTAGRGGTDRGPGDAERFCVRNGSAGTSAAG